MSILLACVRPDAQPVSPPRIEQTTQAAPDVEGLVLRVLDAPAGLSIEVEASDDRPPIVPRRSARSEERLLLPPGFVTVVLTAGEDVRRLQFHMGSTAELTYRWGSPDEVQSAGIVWLARDRAEAEAKVSFDALMSAMKTGDDDASAAALEAELQRQAEALANREDDAYAHLLRLHHATNAIQIAGPEAAWSAIEPIPADSVAWAAFSGRLLELRALFGDMPEAVARFGAVRKATRDVGLEAAFRACDLYFAERSGEPTELARAYVESTRLGEAPRVGTPMPSFELVDLQGRPIRSGTLQGTPYLVEVWSTWCKPCVEQMGALHALHEELGEDVRIISISVNDAKAPIDEFRANRWPMPWIHAWVPDGAPLYEAWAIDSVPYVVFVDAAGVVLAADRHVDLEFVRTAVQGAAPGQP